MTDTASVPDVDPPTAVSHPAPTGILRRPRVCQLLRYGAVSIIATGTSMIVLGALVSTHALPAAWANVAATAVGTVPSFELNRRWVWGKTGQRSLAAEVGPFVALSFAGLGLSTLAVGAADHWAGSAQLSSLARTSVVEAASLTAFGSLWLAQFAILDRLLFRSASPRTRTRTPDGSAGEDPPIARCAANEPHGGNSVDAPRHVPAGRLIVRP